MAKIISDSKLFRDISEAERLKMLKCSKAQEKEYAPEEYIFQQGQKPSRLFLILEGTVMVAKNFASGKRDVLFFVQAGDVFGEMFLFADADSYWYDAIAQGKVRTLEIPWTFFYGFCKNRNLQYKPKKFCNAVCIFFCKAAER